MATTPAQRGQRTGSKPAPRTFAPPVMRVTRYDRVSSFMMSLILGTVGAVCFVVLQWYAIRKPPPLELVPLEMVVGGGYEDGNPDETLQVESPEQVDPNASPVDEQVEQEELMEVLETVVELSDRATKQVQQVQASQSTGTPGSAVGTGGRPLGSGGGPGGGIPAHQRWYIRFNESSTAEYAKQLDHFGIELAVFYPTSGKIAYAKNFSAKPPPKPIVKEKWDDDRIYFKWSGGPRERIDRELLQKSGVDPAGGQIFQFYPNQTIQLLGTIEQNFANRSAKEIRRTYFVVTPQGGGYTFTVTRQTYLR